MSTPRGIVSNIGEERKGGRASERERTCACVRGMGGKERGGEKVPSGLAFYSRHKIRLRLNRSLVPRQKSESRIFSRARVFSH